MMFCCDWLVFNSCDWCVSILTVPVGCSHSGPLFCSSFFVVFLNHGHQCFWNFNSIIPVDVVMVKSYVNRLFDPACVPMWITINKLYLVPKRIVPSVVICWIWASQMSQSCSFILLHRSFSLTDVNLAAFTGNSVNNAVLFSRVGMVFWLY